MEKTNKKFFWQAALATVIGSAICYLAVSGYFLFQGKLALENELQLASARSVATAKIFAAKTASLNKQVESLNSQVNSLNNTIDQIESDLEMTQDERDKFEKKYKREKSRMDEFNSQIDDLMGNVDTLAQLEATDDELLMKYSKVYFLNENYVPESLDTIDPKYTINPDEDYFFYSKTLPLLKDMLHDAASDGINLKIVSAYRSFAQQSSLKSTYAMVYGSGANQFSADQGYSEHQLGTTIDLTTAEIGTLSSVFDQSTAYKWLVDNAYKYGFILSYPKNNSYYQYEPWHWRFVGRDLADKLHEDNKNFYDMDQREIDEYQISLFD